MLEAGWFVVPACFEPLLPFPEERGFEASQKSETELNQQKEHR
jgi:hypothetical protein